MGWTVRSAGSSRCGLDRPGLVGLKGGELVLVGADTLRALDDRLTLARALDQLSQAGVAAVAARGGIDQAAIARADALGFPLLSIPLDASLTQSEQDALRLLADRQAETLELTRQVQQQLTELLIAGHGLPAIVDRLAVLTRRAVAVEDASGVRQLSGAAVSLPDRTQVVEALERTRPRLFAWIDGRRVPAADPPTQRFRLEIDGIGRIVAPIAADDGALAFLSLIAPHESLGRSDALSASQGATVCALVLARERAVLQAEDRLRRDVVTDLLSGAFTSDSALLERAERLGFNLAVPHLPIALRVAAEPPAAAPRPHDVVSALVRELGRLGVSAPVGVLGETIGLAYPLDGGEPAAVAARVHRLAAQVSGRVVSAGVGPAGVGPAAIAQGYREADRALVIARRLFPPGRADLLPEPRRPSAAAGARRPPGARRVLRGDAGGDRPVRPHQPLGAVADARSVLRGGQQPGRDRLAPAPAPEHGGVPAAPHRADQRPPAWRSGDPAGAPSRPAGPTRPGRARAGRRVRGGDVARTAIGASPADSCLLGRDLAAGCRTT